VSVSDIVNNLTTNVANKPLSAAQGVALKALIDAITIPTKLSQLDNDKGFIAGYTETDPTVPAWAKAESKPSYSKSEVGLGNVDDVKQYSASNPPPYPVTSVNGQAGDVKLDMVTDAVRYGEQSLTPEQQAQARKNIGADYVVQDTAPEDTSVLWVDPTDNSDDGFQEAVNAALAQAKSSGEFDGKTPVKGTDYFTAADKAEMVNDVIAALPVYAGEVV
jgi:hypothetical protein